MTSTTDIGSRLRSCNCIADAKNILRETTQITPTTFDTATTLLETAFAIRDNPVHTNKLKETAIKEVEDDLVSKPSVAKVGKGEEDIDKLVKESGDVVSGTGTAGSEQSSAIKQPYPKEGTDGEVTDLQGASGEDQMKEGIPGMMPGIAPQGLAPQVAQEMGQQMPPLPQMNTPQMMKQMQYTVREALKPILNEIRNHGQAIKALDSRVRETETAKGTMTLDIGSVKENAIAREAPVRETVYQGDNLPKVKFNRMQLQETRNEILEQDQFLSESQ